MATGVSARSWLLVFDTAAEACSAALGPWLPGLDDDSMHHRFAPAARGHGERLPGMVEELLAEAGIGMGSLAAIACGIGPGAFAGVRIGAGYAQGLALALDIPVAGLVSLEMMAVGLFAAGARKAWCALDARMGEIYVAAYEAGPDGRPAVVVAPAVTRPDVALLPPADWAGQAWAAGGPGFAAYPDLLSRASRELGSPARFEPTLLPTARHVLRLARHALGTGGPHGPEDLRPVYLRDHVALTLVEQNAARLAKK